MASLRPLRHVFHGAIAFLGLAAGASCGSRTGLFGPELSATMDVRNDLPDARVDGPLDAPVDAPIDVIDEPVACVPGRFTFTMAIPQLMFVLDRSGSMNFELTSNSPALPGQVSRWGALESALSQTMTPFSSEIAMGARFFPAAGANGFDPILACIQDQPSLAIAPALDNATKILEAFSKTSPVGGTPTATALDFAAQQVSSSRAVARAMVVATDGAPNCNAALNRNTCTCTSTNSVACTGTANGAMNCLDDARTVQTIADIFDNEKIPVYIIGIGVTGDFSATLDAMAIAGGRPRVGSPKYYRAETPAEMTAAFTHVRDSVAKCSYITPSSPHDPDAIVVDIDGEPIARDPGHVDGWDWIDQAYGHLQLFGSACGQASATNVSGTVTCSERDP